MLHQSRDFQVAADGRMGSRTFRIYFGAKGLYDKVLWCCIFVAFFVRVVVWRFSER